MIVAFPVGTGWTSMRFTQAAPSPVHRHAPFPPEKRGEIYVGIIYFVALVP